ncbi:hypothetical protein Pla52o_34210 [Novipirellula galeiformis]|uniref:Uncharacterized protein n=1 Tax=Novipirellula galeiformis TaxID=2528004 RepID=A0A5C6CEB9_9BACT|nr:hypothetical protein [Novipirellula galeiformis]TWU22365.1 hypothetical protein Pla52o_34210 [Novipirellula galeiformis]
MAGKLHVFTGSFPSRADACLYTEAQWEPKPDDSVSDEEYAAWEDRNPVWGFRNDLGDAYLDSDFIETIDGHRRYKYLETYLVNDGDLNVVQSAVPDANILLLVFPNALGGFDATLRSTSKLSYCGEFDFRWP